MHHKSKYNEDSLVYGHGARHPVTWEVIHMIETGLSVAKTDFESRLADQEKRFEAKFAKQQKQFETMLDKKQKQFEEHMTQIQSNTQKAQPDSIIKALPVAVAVEVEEQPLYLHEIHKNDTKQQQKPSTTISKKKGDSVEHCIEELYKLIEQTDNEKAKRMLEETIVSLLDTK